ncbi:hypothetical protein CVU75_02230 [Candidatus Dependentiae bacterium HGW-Dependentiae-1]|nr:MAG: hypothetical protein CVU75_02230 [Candidatus Dependentiae bacterium HGW-Dependentiae-1]
MFKNHFFTLSCLVVSFASTSILHADEKKNVVVAWDIHGVLCSQPAWTGHNCRPNTQTVELVKKLHAQGVKQVIFSNISQGSMRKLQQKFPELFNCFDWSKSMANAEGIFTRKPHGKYIEKFLAKTGSRNANNIVFFDDKENNVRAACRYGMDAHVFSDAAQATQVLKQKHIL